MKKAIVLILLLSLLIFCSCSRSPEEKASDGSKEGGKKTPAPAVAETYNPKAEDLVGAAATKDLNRVRELIMFNNKLVNMKARNEGQKGMTALHYAAYNNHYEMANYILRHGGKTNIKSTGANVTPLHFASEYADKKLILLLIDRGADVNAKDKLGLTALHKAAFKGRTKIVRLMAKEGAEIDAEDNLGRTPLHWAARYGKIDVAKALLQNKADINAVSNAKRTPVDLATVHGEKKFADFLKSKGGKTREELLKIEQQKKVEEIKSRVIKKTKNQKGAPVKGNKK